MPSIPAAPQEQTAQLVEQRTTTRPKSELSKTSSSGLKRTIKICSRTVPNSTAAEHFLLRAHRVRRSRFGSLIFRQVSLSAGVEQPSQTLVAISLLADRRLARLR